MSQSIEWAHAGDNAMTLLLGDEAAADGNVPCEAEDDDGTIALVVDGCALYGQPAELLELLSDGISQISAHLAGR